VIAAIALVWSAGAIRSTSPKAAGAAAAMLAGAIVVSFAGAQR
jgi:hypothetical protein